MSSEECCICIETLSTGSVVRLECDHSTHGQCMRKLLRHLSRNHPDEDEDDEEPKYLCPMCRGEVDTDLVNRIVFEPRNLCFRYLMPRSVSDRPETKFRVVVQVGSSLLKSHGIKVEELPVYEDSPPHRVLIIDFEFDVHDPRRKFQVWVEEVDTHAKLSGDHYVGTTPTDHDSSDEEGEDTTIVRDPERQQTPVATRQPRPADRREVRRRRRPNPIAEVTRRGDRLGRRTIALAANITTARRALERARDVVITRQAELQFAMDTFRESLNEFVEFRFPNGT